VATFNGFNGHAHKVLVCVFSPWLKNYSFSSYHLKVDIWSSGIGKKIVTFVRYIAKLTDGSKRVKNFFETINEKKVVKMERER
jgi:hypothetical protein